MERTFLCVWSKDGKNIITSGSHAIYIAHAKWFAFCEDWQTQMINPSTLEAPNYFIL